MKDNKLQYDKVLLIITLLLLGIGIIEVFSSSYYLDIEKTSNFILKSHIKSVIVGLFAMGIFTILPYKIIKKMAYLVIIPMFLGFIVLYATSGNVNGSTRWIKIGGFSYMPSEWAKLFVIIIMSKALTMRERFIKSFSMGVLPYLGFGMLISFMIYKQPNMSDAVIVFLIVLGLIFIAGIEWKYVIALIGTGAFAVGGMIYAAPYRIKRFLVFRDPFSDPLGTGWQSIQSLYAIGSGGLFGAGLGLSTQNKLYLPEPQNDFILATIGEELGFLGISFLLFLFLILIYKGFKIALAANDKFAFFLATGITLMISLQVMINFLVVASLMPVTGITLPLISHGGNSLIVILSSIGILLNISKYGPREV